MSEPSITEDAIRAARVALSEYVDEYGYPETLATFDALVARVASLTEALEAVANSHRTLGGMTPADPAQHCTDLVRIARAALASEEGEPATCPTCGSGDRSARYNVKHHTEAGTHRAICTDPWHTDPTGTDE
jgi:hypothetical protein